MGILDDKKLCAILVTTESDRGAVRVADVANVGKQREKGFDGYGKIDINPPNPKEVWGAHVILVKHGQTAVVEGRPTLRLFVRVQVGTGEEVGMACAEDAWTFRHTVPFQNIS